MKLTPAKIKKLQEKHNKAIQNRCTSRKYIMAVKKNNNGLFNNIKKKRYIYGE